MTTTTIQKTQRTAYDDTITVLITFSPKTNTTANNVNRLIDNYCNKLFYRLLSFADFELNPELNLSGNIHFHGFISYRNCYKKDYQYFILALKSYGFVKVNKVKHSLQDAMVYPRKDRETLRGLIKDSYLPISESNYQSWSKIDFDHITTYFKDNDIQVEDIL